MVATVHPQNHDSQSIAELDLSTPQISIPTNIAPGSISHRQTTEIQLKTLLNEHICFLPYFIRQATESLPSDKELTIEEISKTLGTQPFIIERIINVIILSSDDNESAPTLNRNIIQKLTRVFTSTLDVRCLVFFKVLDENRNQYVEREEVSAFYTRYLNTIQSFNKNLIPRFIRIILKRYHLDTNARIDFDEFYSIITSDKTLLNSFNLFSVSPIWFVKQKTSQSRQNIIQRCCLCLSHQGDVYNERVGKLTLDNLRDNLSRVIMVLLYILVNLALMLYAAIYEAVVVKEHVLIVFARMSGMLLNFNCVFIVVLMLKQTILLMRTTQLHKWLPIDDHIDFHRFVGRSIAVLSLIHTIAYVSNFARLKGHSWATYMFTTSPGIGWVNGFTPLSGVILCIILAIIIICSMQWTRRGGHFQIFYWTHLLYIPFFVFLIVHAQDFWKWAIGPLTLFVLEKVYSIITRFSSRRGRTYLLSATIEQSNVVSLTIHRPKYFSFKPGDYILINLPRVTLYEFHPFTISSGPEKSDNIHVHIQAIGNWTKRVYEHFKSISERNDNEVHVKVHRADLEAAVIASEESLEVNTVVQLENGQIQTLENAVVSTSSEPSRPVKKHKETIIINGPYSSCARYIFDSKHVVLICSGIGITPYASILSSLIAQFRASRMICKHCQRTSYTDNGLWTNHRLKKVDFIWVNRDAKSFEWFLNLLREFEREQEEYYALNKDEQRFLNIQLYFTGINGGTSIDNFFLHHTTNMWAEETGTDVFTGLRAPTRFGRPAWDELLQSLKSSSISSTADDIKVFFCGLESMRKIIQQHCTNLRIRCYNEKF